MALVRVTIIGAGPAGLATAAALQRRGVKTLVLDCANRIGDSWRRHYDRLTLHTVRSLSGLPDYPIPKAFGRWVPKARFIEYLEWYAAQSNVQPELGITVHSISRGSGCWILKTSAGDVQSESVVVATGANRIPFTPAWPGLETYQGEFIHASGYRNANPYVGREVLVVGCGNTGAEIATELSEAGVNQLKVAVRTPPSILLREVAGIPAQLMGVALHRLPASLVDAMATQFRKLTVGDLRGFGLAQPSEGVFHRCQRANTIPVIDVGFVAQIKRRRIEFVPSVERFTKNEVLLSDGTLIVPDAVIAATGYRPGLEQLVCEKDVLQRDGRPLRSPGGVRAALPGLYFIGFTAEMSGVLRRIGQDAVRITQAIAGTV